MEVKKLIEEMYKVLKVGGIYEHYATKQKYKILHLALDASNASNLNKLIIYQALYGDFLVWSRNFYEFTEMITSEQPRFKLIE